MGNSASDNKTDLEYDRFIHSMTLIRKEQSENLGRNFDLYRPEDVEFEESLVLLIELTFDENEYPMEKADAAIARFKEEVNQRKSINSPNLTKLLFLSYKIISGMCIEHLVCRLALEFSDENLFKVLNDRLMYRSNAMIPDLPSPASFQWFLTNMIEGLSALHQRSMVHGYVMPVNVMIYNKTSKQPHYRLLDVALISRYKK